VTMAHIVCAPEQLLLPRGTYRMSARRAPLRYCPSLTDLS